MQSGPFVRREEYRSWYDILVATDVPRIPGVVRTLIPRERLVVRGEVPSSVQNLHHIEPNQNLYLHRRIGTNLLAREGLGSLSIGRVSIATELARVR